MILPQFLRKVNHMPQNTKFLLLKTYNIQGVFIFNVGPNTGERPASSDATQQRYRPPSRRAIPH